MPTNASCFFRYENTMTSNRLIRRLLSSIELLMQTSTALNTFELVKQSLKLDGALGGKVTRVQSAFAVIHASDLEALQLSGLTLNDIYGTFDFRELSDVRLARLLARACYTHEAFVFGLSSYEASRADFLAYEARANEEQSYLNSEGLRLVTVRREVWRQEFHRRCAAFRIALDQLYDYRDKIADDAFNNVPPPCETNEMFVREHGTEHQ